MVDVKKGDLMFTPFDSICVNMWVVSIKYSSQVDGVIMCIAIEIGNICTATSRIGTHGAPDF